MSRKVNLGDNRDITFGSIRYYFLSLFLRIETTIRFAVIFTGVTSDDCFCPLGTDFCQLRVFLDFQTPTLVFSNMPMETIHIMQSHHINISLHFIYSKEMTTRIKMCATISETGSILYLYCRQSNLRTYCDRQ